MTQLCMFLGYARGGFWGGLLAGLCFVLPAFGIMLALTLIYAHLGAIPIMRSGLYGLGPVVLGIFDGEIGVSFFVGFVIFGC